MSKNDSPSEDDGNDRGQEAANSDDANPSGGRYRTPQVILDEMLESIRLIQQYTDGVSFESFEGQQLLRDAVILRIAILGEAASHLRDEDKARWPAVPWRIVTDMRNRLIHGYFAVRLDLVWQVVVADLPSLAAQLQAIRDSLA